MFPARIDLCARRDAARAACDAACDSLETRDSFSACYGEAEPMSVAAPVVRSVHPPEEALERALSDVARLRADLARRVAAATSDAVTDAGDTEQNREDGSRVDDSDDPDPSASVDQLVTRLRALHSARDACVSQMRLEGAIREVESAASARTSRGASPRPRRTRSRTRGRRTTTAKTARGSRTPTTRTPPRAWIGS